MRDADHFLPNFCQIRSVYLLVLAAQLLAFALTAAAPGKDPWQTLGLVSLYVQWIALASGAALCLLRRLLERAASVWVTAVSYCLVLAVTAAVATAADRLLPTRLDADFLPRSLIVAGIVAAIVLRYFYVAHEWRRGVESEASARLDALQARIRPHFLFNSLNTIAAMIADQPRQAEAAVEDLADLFRASLGRSGRLVPLADELELARGYLRVEALRLGPRLETRWQIESLPQDALIPPLTLQPLLEDAVHHGIEPRVGGGVIEVTGTMRGDVLHVCVNNPDGGAERRTRKGSGMALGNIRERLAFAFGERAGLRLERGENGYRAMLDWPYVRHHEDLDRR